MDPLSITCGIITISGVVLGSLKVLSTVLGASDEGIALMNEVTELQVVLRDVQSILEGSKKAEIESLQSALAKLNKSVLLLHDFIHTRLLKEEDLDTDLGSGYFGSTQGGSWAVTQKLESDGLGTQQRMQNPSLS